jgi:nitrate/nitrite transport system permease protein
MNMTAALDTLATVPLLQTAQVIPLKMDQGTGAAAPAAGAAPIIQSTPSKPSTRSTNPPPFPSEPWLRPWVLLVLPPLLGLALFIGGWSLLSQYNAQFPGPVKTWTAAVVLFSDPFYSHGPNDQGIGLNILSSLKRVSIGFGLAALIGIPLGFLIGRFQFINRMTGLIISILRPVSPLAWLPIGLLVFQAAEPAAIWVICVSSIWPMIINTAVGVSQIPQDYLNVARVLQLSEWKIFTRILFPATLPYVMTGVRLSIGIAWLVIVAAEMLTGGVGLGFWVWDEWNNLNVEHIIIAIFVVGLIGLLLEQALLLLARRFQYD